MVTQTQTNRTGNRLEALLILGVGVTAGGTLALLLVGLALSGRLRLLLDLVADLAPLLPGDLPAAHELLIMLMNEASLMGWPLVADTPAYWYISRGAGLVGYLLLWAATAWGLVISTKVARGLVAAPLAMGLHEFLSLASLAFAALHALVLLGDRYIDFSLADIVYPFAASYRPGWVGLGQLGLYMSAGLTLSFYLRKRIGAKTWRQLHYLTFLAYGMVAVHGLAAGTDSSAPPVQVMYLLTGGVILFLAYYRLFTVGGKRR